MATVERPSQETHQVANQSVPLENYNSFSADRVLVEAVRREGADWAEQRISELGALCGTSQVIRWGELANKNTPILRTHDRFGHRIDEVEFDSSWHELMEIGISSGLHATPWLEPGPGAHVARAAAFMQLSYAEAGVGCPISMTYSAIPALRMQPDVAAEWEPRFLSLEYDRRVVPPRGKGGGGGGVGKARKEGGAGRGGKPTR